MHWFRKKTTHARFNLHPPKLASTAREKFRDFPEIFLENETKQCPVPIKSAFGGFSPEIDLLTDFQPGSKMSHFDSILALIKNDQNGQKRLYVKVFLTKMTKNTLPPKSAKIDHFGQKTPLRKGVLAKNDQNLNDQFYPPKWSNFDHFAVKNCHLGQNASF